MIHSDDNKRAQENIERYELADQIADLDEDIWYKRDELANLEFHRLELSSKYLKKYGESI